MGGGLIQLSAIGKENSYLTSNPQISFFKAVYKKYANFSMQSIKIDIDSQDSLDFNNITKMKIKLKKNGDLINKMFLNVRLPNILSSIKRENLISENDLEFKWIDNIGYAMIKNVKVSIGGEVIEDYDGEYLYIYQQNYQSQEKIDIVSDIVSSSDPYNNIEKKYNSYSNKKTYTKNSIDYLNKDYNNSPSIENKIIRIPLPFWFHRNIGCSLPICALEYHDVMIELEFRPIKELFIITNKQGINLVSNPNLDSVYHSQHSTSEVLSKSREDILNCFENKRWILEPYLDVTYIFLEEELKKAFMSKSLYYLVEPINKQILKDKSGNINYRTEFYHPVKELYIIPRRNDVNKRNMWLNFTNLDDDSEKNYYDYQNMFYKIAKSESDTNNSNSGIYYLGAFVTNQNKSDLMINDSDWNTTEIDNDYDLRGEDCYLKEDIENFLNIWKYRIPENIPYIDQANYKYFTPDIISNMNIEFDQVERVSKREYNYYNKIQPFLSNINSNIEGPILYSFSLNGSRLQPSGKCNFSHIKNVTFNIDLKNPIGKEDTGVDYKYDLTFYSRYYNVLNINSGTADLVIRN